ncbi:hypothetical protein [Halorubrum sp. F4]|uniref:hypothetical protein n=1 Tax=Halorubrum sp. F4 TaxID=2989715 RepID=UPI00248049E4|nr:hypothetical protein [Halorubrum sp. F4]
MVTEVVLATDDNRSGTRRTIGSHGELDGVTLLRGEAGFFDIDFPVTDVSDGNRVGVLSRRVDDGRFELVLVSVDVGEVQVVSTLSAEERDVIVFLVDGVDATQRGRILSDVARDVFTIVVTVVLGSIDIGRDIRTERVAVREDVFEVVCVEAVCLDLDSVVVTRVGVDLVLDYGIVTSVINSVLVELSREVLNDYLEDEIFATVNVLTTVLRGDDPLVISSG